jgi:hypothetical protein
VQVPPLAELHHDGGAARVVEADAEEVDLRGA